MMNVAKAKKKTTSKSGSRDRVVYEVKGQQGITQVNATSTAELKSALTPLLGLDNQSIQAVAHIAHVERATVTGQGWSIRRLGVLAFVPDTETAQPQRRAGRQQGKNAQQPSTVQSGVQVPAVTTEAVQPEKLLPFTSEKP